MSGSGTITSEPAGINCGLVYATSLGEINAQTTLTFTPASGARFLNWSGDCSGTNPITVVINDKDRDQQCTANVVDELPNDFNLGTVSDATPNSAAQVQVTISNINVTVTVMVEGGSYSIAGGAYTTTPSSITNNQSIILRVLASNYNSVKYATLSVGNLTRVFVVNAQRLVPTPDAFGFPSVVDATRNTFITSAPTRITGMPVDAPISITGGEYIINDNPPTNVLGMIANNSTLSIRILSANGFNTTKVATVIVGTVTETFSVTTEATDTDPHPISFNPLTQQATDTLVYSERQTITGINATTSITVVGGSYTLGLSNQTQTAGELQPGDAIA